MNTVLTKLNIQSDTCRIFKNSTVLAYNHVGLVYPRNWPIVTGISLKICVKVLKLISNCTIQWKDARIFTSMIII